MFGFSQAASAARDNASRLANALAGSGVPSPIPLPVQLLAHAVMHGAQDTTNALRTQVPAAVREVVPAQYRWLVSSLLGDRSPLTEKNYSPAELAALQAVVAKDQTQLPERAAYQRAMAPVWAKLAAERQNALSTVQGLGRNLTPEEAGRLGVDWTDTANTKFADAKAQLTKELADAQRLHDQALNVSRRASAGIGAVRYAAPDQMSAGIASGYPLPPKLRDGFLSDMPQQHLGPVTAGLDYGDRNVNALANTLGEFVYKAAPNGGVTIDDNYNWGHFRQTNAGDNGAPYTPSLAQAVGLLATTGNVEPLISRLMPDASAGRPVHIVLPPNPPQVPATPPRPQFGFGAQR